MTQVTDDLDYYGWVKAKYWTIEEASLLAVGIVPNHNGDNQDIVIPEAAKLRYGKVLGLAQRYFKGRDGTEDGKAIPIDFIKWAVGENFDLPETLVECAFERDAKRKVLAKEKLGEKEKANLLRIIGVLLRLFFEKDPSQRPYSKFVDQQSIIDMVHTIFGGNNGLSKRHLEGVFAEANRRIPERIDSTD